MAFPVFPFLASTVSNLVNLGRQGDGSLRIPFQVTIVDSPGPLTDVTSILSSRGAFYRVELSGRRGPAMYAIDELTRDRTFPEVFPFAQNLAFDAETQTDEENYQELADRNQRSLELQQQQNAAGTFAPVLITGIQLAQTDITSAVPCLDNFKVFYTFGQNFGQVAITGEILLGPHGEVEARGFNRVLQFFARHRVSVSHRPVKLSVLTQVYLVYLTGLQLGRIDPQYHILPFTLTGTLLDPSNDEPGKLNTRSQIVNSGVAPNLFSALSISPDDLTVGSPTTGSPTTGSPTAASSSEATPVPTTRAPAEIEGQAGGNITTPSFFEDPTYGEPTSSGVVLSNTVAGDRNTPDTILAVVTENWRRRAADNVESQKQMRENLRVLGDGWNAGLDWLSTELPAAIDVRVAPVRDYLNEAGRMSSEQISAVVDPLTTWIRGGFPLPEIDWSGPVL